MGLRYCMNHRAFVQVNASARTPEMCCQAGVNVPLKPFCKPAQPPFPRTGLWTNRDDRFLSQLFLHPGL